MLLDLISMTAGLRIPFSIVTTFSLSGTRTKRRSSSLFGKLTWPNSILKDKNGRSFGVFTHFAALSMQKRYKRLFFSKRSCCVGFKVTASMLEYEASRGGLSLVICFVRKAWWEDLVILLSFQLINPGTNPCVGDAFSYLMLSWYIRHFC